MNPLVPPTPTPLPPVLPPLPVDIAESNYRIWKFTDEAVMIWQQVGPARTQVFQVALLLVIVVAAAYMIYRWVAALIEGYQGRNL